MKIDEEAHHKECPDYQIQCPNCEQWFKPNKPDSKYLSHNCIEYLKAKVKQNDEEKLEVMSQLGVNYDRVNVKCDKGKHQLKVHRGYIPKYIQLNRQRPIVCKGCNRQELNKYDMFYTCKE